MLLHASKFDDAIAAADRAVAIWTATRGADDVSLFRLQEFRAIGMRGKGKIAEALTAFGTLLRRAEKALGPIHPVVADIHTEIGSSYYYLQDDDAALVEYRQALAIGNSVNPEGIGVAGLHQNIGSALADLHRLPQAVAEYQAALAIFEKLRGPESPSAGDIHNDLGTVLQNQGKYSDALGEFRRALAIYEKAVGPDAREAGRIRANIADALHALDHNDEALLELRRAQDILTKVLGPSNPSVASLRVTMADILQAQHQLPAALAELQPALAAFEKAIGPDAPYTSQIRITSAVIDSSKTTRSPPRSPSWLAASTRSTRAGLTYCWRRSGSKRRRRCSGAIGRARSRSPAKLATTTPASRIRPASKTPRRSPSGSRRTPADRGHESRREQPADREVEAADDEPEHLVELRRRDRELLGQRVAGRRGELFLGLRDPARGGRAMNAERRGEVVDREAGHEMLAQQVAIAGRKAARALLDRSAHRRAILELDQLEPEVRWIGQRRDPAVAARVLAHTILALAEIDEQPRRSDAQPTVEVALPGVVVDLRRRAEHNFFSSSWRRSLESSGSATRRPAHHRADDARDAPSAIAASAAGSARPAARASARSPAWQQRSTCATTPSLGQ